MSVLSVWSRYRSIWQILSDVLIFPFHGDLTYSPSYSWLSCVFLTPLDLMSSVTMGRKEINLFFCSSFTQWAKCDWAPIMYIFHCEKVGQRKLSHNPCSLKIYNFGGQQSRYMIYLATIQGIELYRRLLYSKMVLIWEWWHNSILGHGEVQMWQIKTEYDTDRRLSFSRNYCVSHPYSSAFCLFNCKNKLWFSLYFHGLIVQRYLIIKKRNYRMSKIEKKLMITILQLFETYLIRKKLRFG